MKPVLLEIEAFGPYSDLQVIDFRILKDVNMFLIHGATGGGKTTILDAICYALYGDTSGNERDAESMRSHFAKEDQLTQVKFTFKIGESTYYIHRIPGQDRPKKVGTGFTYQNPEAELYKLGQEEAELLASGVTKARDKVIDIIGFDSDQFRQVIMIPQGQFRKLLVAKSEERQKILGEIFQTRKYKQVEDKIREEERKLKNEVAAIKERRKEQIKNIKYKPDTLLEELMRKENMDPPQVINEVEVLCKAQEEEINQIHQEIILSHEKMKRLAKQITIAVNNREKYNEKLKVEKQYEQLIDQEKLYLIKEKEYHLAQKALPLYTVEQYIKDLMIQKQKSENETLEVSKKIKDLNVKYQMIKIQMDKCKNQEPQTRELELKLHKALEEYRPKSISLIDMEKDQLRLTEEINRVRKKEKVLKEQKIAIEKEILQAEKILEERQNLNDELRNQELRGVKLSNILLQKRQLVQLEKRHQDLRSQYQKVARKKKQHEEEYASFSEIHNNILQQWIKGQAAVLAQNLEADKQCPVCGSTTHPKPAKATNKTPTEQEVNKKKDDLDKAHTLYLEIQKEQVRIETEGKESATQVKEQQEVLGEYANIPLKEIEKLYNKTELQKKQTNEKLTILIKLEEKIIAQKKIKLTLEEEITILQEKDKGHTDILISLNTKIEQIKKEIPELLQSKKELDNYINSIEITLINQKRIYDKTQNEMEEVVSNKIEAETTKKEKELQLQEIIFRYEKESNSFKTERDNAGFKTSEEYKSAYKSQRELEILDTQIKDYHNRRSGLEAQYNKLKEETKDIILLNIEALEEEYKDIEKNKDNLARKHQTIIVEKEHNENQIAIILKSSKQILAKEKRYSIVGSLYDAVRGKNERGLSFERFIQSSLFEDILIRANERLILMSNNRYELYRSDNRETMASQSGLDMEVLDTYTGKKRHVRTLSGGEGFMASLSLALGLADVVQSYAGGISLDTIFIDEGFGTLDVESLDAAIKTLIDLQQSGRLVGIISHVPELKERIGARLEVVTTQKGSRAKFHI